MYRTYIGVDWYGGIKPAIAHYDTVITIYLRKDFLKLAYIMIIIIIKREHV